MLMHKSFHSKTVRCVITIMNSEIVVVIECIASVNHFSTYKREVDFDRCGKVQKKKTIGNVLDCKFYLCFSF
jgi:hypothetical protein